MLPLDSPRWAELDQAYGSAEGVPLWLEALRDGTNCWEEIWSSLCHQESVFTATFAAVPHIVAIALAAPVASRAPHFFFVGMVAAVEHDDRQPACPADLEADYRAAIAACRRPILELLLSGEVVEPELVQQLLEALCAVHGYDRLGRDLSRAIDGHVLCAGCRESDG
jgi:hypothetical protein